MASIPRLVKKNKPEKAHHAQCECWRCARRARLRLYQMQKAAQNNKQL